MVHQNGMNMGMTCSIKEDHLYLFPSWLEHGSKENKSNETRVTLSFNTTPYFPD